ncbi:MAG: hypothetical protein GX477_10770 [Clostridiaceae bacterium]|jgi:hypothetical protein|nr:hypothetical protein [Clostridiaceae bacterium]
MLEFARKNANLICFFMLFLMVISISAFSFAQYVSANQDPGDRTQPFSDVPENSYAYEPIHRLRKMGVTNGIGNNRFGYGRTITRGEFITLLVKLLGFDDEVPQQGSFSDNRDPKKFYYKPVEIALKRGMITPGDGSFRPNDLITRQDAVVMIINGLGYGRLARRLDYLDAPYEDVHEYRGHISMAREFGIISRASVFNPYGQLKREEAAAMLTRMLDAMEREISELNAFYAISSSSQSSMIPDLTSVCFGWSSLAFDSSSGEVVLNISRTALGQNDFYLPAGFSTRLETARNSGVPAYLMVYAVQSSTVEDPDTGQVYGLPEYVFSNASASEKVIADIAAALEGVSRDNETGSFDGVVIDFEGLKGERLKKGLNEFLRKLRAELEPKGKKLLVAVHPLMHSKRSVSSYDGYDYRTIGELADRVILMAHDYGAKRLTQAEADRGVTLTPLTPIEDVYYALQAITDPVSGVQDKSRIMLQLSFDWVVWKKQDGKTLNQVPLRYNLENFMKLLDSGREISFHYHDDYENPYLKYTDTETGVEYIVWYEDKRSVSAKVGLARYFGIGGISLWRLGLVPDREDDGQNSFGMDVWQWLMAELGR